MHCIVALLPSPGPNYILHCLLITAFIVRVKVMFGGWHYPADPMHIPHSSMIKACIVRSPLCVLVLLSAKPRALMMAIHVIVIVIRLCQAFTGSRSGLADRGRRCGASAESGAGQGLVTPLARHHWQELWIPGRSRCQAYGVLLH